MFFGVLGEKVVCVIWYSGDVGRLRLRGNVWYEYGVGDAGMES